MEEALAEVAVRLAEDPGGAGGVALQERMMRFRESGEIAKVLILKGKVVIV